MGEVLDSLQTVVDNAELEQTVRGEFNRMRGRLCGFIEACGLPEKQERGAIATLKSLSYDSENLIVDLVTAEDDIFEQECTRDHRCGIDGPYNGLPGRPQYINAG